MKEKKAKRQGKFRIMIMATKIFRLQRMEDAYQEVGGNNVEDVKWDQIMEVPES